MAKKAVVLLSGGLDSTTCLAAAINAGAEVHLMTFAYGQRHGVELQAAGRVRNHYRISPDRHLLVDLGRTIHGSALTGDADIPVNGVFGKDIPVTYVPSRNIIFLSHAASYAESIGASDVFIGVNAIDYSGYPDCRPEFIRAFSEVLRVGTKAGVEGNAIIIQAPLLGLGKADIIRLGVRLGAPYHLTHSCYAGTVPACGVCDSCRLRLKGFAEAGLTDPIAYSDRTG